MKKFEVKRNMYFIYRIENINTPVANTFLELFKNIHLFIRKIKGVQLHFTIK